MKKTLIYLPALLLVAGLFGACTKEKNTTPASANLTIANVVVGSGTLTLNTSAQTIANNASGYFPIFAGQTQVGLTDMGVTPAVTYYNQTIPTENSGNYSLFLGGASPSTVDAVVINETYKNYTDSLCGVRFINFAPGSPAISINITGQAIASEVSSLAYKAYSDFKQYPAKKVNTSYSFQIRNATTGALIYPASGGFSLTTPGFHNVTIVFRGIVGGSPAVGVTTVAHP